MPDSTLRIARRFRGPPDSGNGGYVAGMLARALGGSGVEVTLRAPPPLERDLLVEASGGTAELRDGDTLIASARRAAVDVVIPPPLSIDDAAEAETRFSGFAQHNFPGCFVCGPEREVEDGLRIFPGAVADAAARVAGLWHPGASLSSDQALGSEFAWAALDCAGYFAVREAAGVAVLGRIAADIVRPPMIGEALIVMGWGIAQDGRKHHVGTSLHDRGGALVAVATATWITIG